MKTYSRMLNDSEVKYLLALKPEDIDKRKLLDMFADKLNEPKMFNAYDKFDLPKNTFHNDTIVRTTPGRYIFNILAIPKSYLEKYGYYNGVLDSSGIGDLEKTFGNMIIEGSMPAKEYIQYLDRAAWLGFGCAYFMNPSISINTLRTPKDVLKRKNELFEIYKKELEKNNLEVSAKIENELFEMADKEMIETGEEFWDWFKKIQAGKAIPSYKKVTLMGGGIQDPASKEYKVTKSNYWEGLNKEELPVFNNVAITGGYGRAVETAQGGTESKKLTNAMQGVILGEDGSDCGTKDFLDVEITKFNKGLFEYRYIRGSSDDDLILLTPEELNRRVGTTVKMRSPMYCKADNICSKCAGEFYYRLGTKSLGLVTSNLGGTLTNLPMKKFHDLTVGLRDIDLNKYIKKRS